ncbi:MAG: SLC13 family permease [Lachnospiraceae bacterium]
MITVVCAVVSFLGAGASTPAIIGPLAFSLGLKAGIHPILLALSVACATTISGDSQCNGYGGVISKGLIEQTVYAGSASKISFAVWMNAVGKQLLVILVASLIFRVRATQKVEVEKPEEFQPVQRKQLALILRAIAGMLIPMIAVTYAPSEFTRKLVSIMQPQFVMILASLGCAVLHLGSQQVVIEKIPMNTILLISGMSMLLAVAKEAGMVEAISAVMMQGVPKSLVPASLVGFSAFLSFFSSGTGVVCPLLYPMVPHLAQQMGLNPIMLFSCIFVGAMSSSVSPFSTGGAMTIAGCPYRNVKDQLTNWMIPVAILIPVACAVLASVGAFGFFHM